MKYLLTLLMGVVLGAAIVNFGFAPTAPAETQLVTGPIKYNCELSGGKFKNNTCSCRPDGEEIQANVYDEQTGFCQSDIGGPAGDAFSASIGLPYGEYGYYQGIIIDLCQKSGGELSGAACICPSGELYDRTTGQCK